MEIKDIKKIANKFGWGEIPSKDPSMVSFMKGATRINVYYTKMTVATVVNHPTQGRTQLFRKYVNAELFEKICSNPRTHTKLGYKYK